MTDPRLKFWNGRAPKTGWDHCYIAAYTQADAVQLYKDAFDDPPGAVNEIREFFSNCWGNDANRELLPTAKRGVYLTDDKCHSRTFIAPRSRAIVDPAPAEAIVAASEQPMPAKYGELRTGFQRGIKVDVWTYHSPFEDRAHGDMMKAEVRLEPGEGRLSSGRAAGEKGLVFVANSPCFKGELRSSNIETLFAKVQEAFRTYDLSQRGVVWEDWLEVVIEPEGAGEPNDYLEDEDNQEEPEPEERHYGFVLRYKVIPRGVDPRDPKKVYTRESWRGAVTLFPLPKAAGAPDVNPKTGKAAKKRGELGDDYFSAREQRYQYAYIPATPENKAALDSVLAKLQELKVRLAAVLEQKVIRQQLAGIATNLLTFKGDEEVGHGG